MDTAETPLAPLTEEQQHKVYAADIVLDIHSPMIKRPGVHPRKISQTVEPMDQPGWTSPIALAYAAGIVDGEGTIVVGHNAKRRCMNLAVRVRVVDKCLPVWMIEQFGGITLYQQHGWKSAKNLWGWALYGRRTRHFLEAIIPYLIIKRRQAEAVMDWEGSSYERRLEMKDRVSTLNQRNAG